MLKVRNCFPQTDSSGKRREEDGKVPAGGWGCHQLDKKAYLQLVDKELQELPR